MLELDLLLEPFARHQFELLSAEQQQLYQEFLTYEDQDIYTWLMLREEPARAPFNDLIRLILENSRNHF